MQQVLFSAGVVAGIGLLLGLILGLAGKLLAVAVNEKEIKVRECLPGVNCGACGFAGCDAYAAAVAGGKAATNLCLVAGAAGAEKIAAVMGQKAESVARSASIVHCSGSCEKARQKYIYEGIQTCEAAAMAPGGGPQACTFGCLGFGTCAQVCPQHCIRIEDGVAVVDRERCVACGLCVNACPKHLLSIVPYEGTMTVLCSSHDKGKAVKAACDAGCIGCGLCAKNCPSDAIQMVNDLAVIDPALCTGCGTCAEKCPVHVIH